MEPVVRDVFLSDLPLEFNEKDVRSLCQPYGAIRNIKLFKPKHQLKGRYSFVTYAMHDQAVAAINALNGYVLPSGCSIRAKWANPTCIKPPQGGMPGMPHHLFQPPHHQNYPHQQEYQPHRQPLFPNFPPQQSHRGYHNYQQRLGGPPHRPTHSRGRVSRGSLHGSNHAASSGSLRMPKTDASHRTTHDSATIIHNLEDSVEQQRARVKELEEKLASLEALDVDNNLKAIQRLRVETLERRTENSEVRKGDTLAKIAEKLRCGIEVHDRINEELYSTTKLALKAFHSSKYEAEGSEKSEDASSQADGKTRALVEALAAYLVAFPREETQKCWRQVRGAQNRLCAAFPFLTELRPKQVSLSDAKKSFKTFDVAPAMTQPDNGANATVVAQRSNTALKDLLAGLKCTQTFLTSPDERLPGLGNLSRACIAAFETELKEAKSANADLIDNPQLELLACGLKHNADSLHERLVEYNDLLDVGSKLSEEQPSLAAECLSELLTEKVSLTMLRGEEFGESLSGGKSGKRKSPARNLFNGLVTTGINTIQEEEEDDEEKAK